MKFGQNKLPPDAIRTLRRVSVGDCAPCTLLAAPAYVYLAKNRKFVAIKRALHFFSAAELDKLRPFENFYLPELVDLAVPFQTAGESVRQLLDVRERRSVQTNQGPLVVTMPMAAHERGDAVRRLIAPLWRPRGEGNLGVDPLLVCFFADQFCPTLTREQITAAAARSEVRFELALLRSCTAVFLALHIGYADLGPLRELRERVFARTIDAGAPTGADSALPAGELADLARLAERLLPENTGAAEDYDALDADISRDAIAAAAPAGGIAARKLLGRLEHIAGEAAPRAEGVSA